MLFPDEHFKYGPVRIGGYIGLVSVIPVFPAVIAEKLGIDFLSALVLYASLLVWLGISARKTLVKTGLFYWYSNHCHKFSEWRNRAHTERCRREVDGKKRLAKYKYRRFKDPSLPRNW